PNPLPRHNKDQISSGQPCGAQPAVGSAGTSALPGLEPTLDLVDHIDPPLAADQAIVAVAAAQRFQRVADFHGCCSGSRGRAVYMRWQFARKLGMRRALVNTGGRICASSRNVAES